MSKPKTNHQSTLLIKTWKALIVSIKLLIVSVVILSLDEGNALAQKNQNDSGKQEEEYINLGYISVSPKYKLGPRAKNIIFKIRNNATRSIQNIFGWVYEFQEGEEGEASEFRLVNNPNKGGIIDKGGAHEPTKEENWRFPLIAANPPINPSNKFTLLVDPRGIRFASFEK